jgi:hypothetical protein
LRVSYPEEKVLSCSSLAKLHNLSRLFLTGIHASHEQPSRTGSTSPILVFAFFLLTISLACNPDSGETLPQAYVAPASVNLRAQLNQKNSTVAVLTHGEKVGILEVRRRYLRVRTEKGAEGWIDSLDLLSPDEMQRIKREREHALTLPSEGVATAFETLNIHLAPNRRSPAFAQIPEGGAVSILDRKIVPRNAPAPQFWPTTGRPTPPTHKQRKSRPARNNFRQPPRPAPPGPPADWQETWGTTNRAEGPAHNAPNPAAEPDKIRPAPQQRPASEQAVMEAWTLIRTKTNQVGWVLSRNLLMSIPDEVAQYAEGRHITSYFDLGAVNDAKEGLKHNWLWTTASVGQTADFDSWRVFLWNRRRHRYETSYRERDLEGYFPVRVDPPDSSPFGRTFSLITKEDDGKFRRRTYLFDGVRVHLTKTEDYHAGESNTGNGVNALNPKNLPSKAQDNWLKRRWTALRKRLFGAS